ncbi:MAG: porin [Deltaproteobacteria bacterium]|nr:porin [Deltaproteobacteria bacterium]
MKGKIIAVGLLSSLAVAGNANAKSLEDVLKEKGVITEADYKEVAKSSKPFEYKLGKGVTFTSADEKFQFSLGGRMQYRYTFMDYDKDSTSNDSSKFEAKRIRLIAQGYAYSKDLTYKLEIDPVQLAQNDGRGGLLDSFINYKVMDELQFLVGQTKVKYGYTNIQSDGALMFVDRVPFIGKMVPGYELGAFAHGQVANGLFDYALSVTNGDGQTTAAGTNHNAFAARVAVSPLGKMANDEPDLVISKKPLFTIGANYFYNDLDADEAYSTSSNYGGAWNGYEDLQNFGADAHFKWMGLAVQGEVLYSQGDLKTTDVGKHAMGFYGQTGYMVTPKLGLALRYSQFDPNRSASGDLQTEQIGAVSYYFDKHLLKVQADVGNIHKQTSTGPTDDMQYRVQVQLVF